MTGRCSPSRGRGSDASGLNHGGVTQDCFGKGHDKLQLCGSWCGSPRKKLKRKHKTYIKQNRAIARASNKLHAQDSSVGGNAIDG